jgi:sulfur-oxidizing protein SoxB
VKGIDVCLSGHTHNRLHKPVLQGKTLVIQSGCHGSFLGRLDLDVEGGQVVGYQHQLIEVKANTNPDPAVDDLIRQALAPYQDELSTVVGETATALNRATMLESAMDNFLLQALLENTDAQLAFSNGWRFGAPIIPGKVTLNDLYNIIPMNPPISTVELTGEELVLMLEENLERTFAPDPYEQMGGYVKRGLGLTVYLKIENPPGHRIQTVFVGNKEVQAAHIYKAAFITEKGIAHKYGRQRENRSERMIDAMQAYLARHQQLHAELRRTFVVV